MKKWILYLMIFSIIFVITGCSSQDDNKLTLDKVIELSQKGDDLSWRDFEKYESKEIGSGLYILLYELEEDFYLLIGGLKDQKPIYIRLGHDTNQDGFVDNDDYIDIREENVEAFVKRVSINEPDVNRKTY